MKYYILYDKSYFHVWENRDVIHLTGECFHWPIRISFVGVMSIFVHVDNILVIGQWCSKTLKISSFVFSRTEKFIQVFWGSIHLMLNIHFPYWLPNLIRNIHLLVNELKSWATNHDTMLMLHICGTRATLVMCFTSLFFPHIWRIILPTPDTSWYKM